jgi:hypothetical protein
VRSEIGTELSAFGDARSQSRRSRDCPATGWGSCAVHVQLRDYSMASSAEMCGNYSGIQVQGKSGILKKYPTKCSMSTRHTSRNRCDPSVFRSHLEFFYDQRIGWIAPISRTHPKRSFTRHLLPSFSLLLRGFASISLLQYCSWLYSVLRLGSQWAALHHLMEYVEGLPSLKISYRRRIKHIRTCSLGMLTRTGDSEIAHPDDPHLANS